MSRNARKPFGVGSVVMGMKPRERAEFAANSQEFYYWLAQYEYDQDSDSLAPMIAAAERMEAGFVVPEARGFSSRTLIRHARLTLAMVLEGLGRGDSQAAAAPLEVLKGLAVEATTDRGPIPPMDPT